MAAAGTRAQKPVGSSAWIEAEKENVQQLLTQEMEEVEYPARHEMDWLNEHMAEIFNGSQFNVTDIFKTPAKMRGKTPRTARKHATPREARVPLSDIFSSGQNIRNSPAPPTRFNNEIAKLAPKNDSKWSPPSQNQNSNPNYNTDSGYHGMPDEDEMEMIQPNDGPETETQTATQPLDESTIVPRDRNDYSPSVDRRTTESSFHSAREVAPSKETTAEPMDVDHFEYQIASQKRDNPPAHTLNKDAHQNDHQQDITMNDWKPDKERDEDHEDGLDNHLDDIGSPSDGSTPDRPPIRKSSLTFASLPAREPLTKKNSIGGRMSRTSHVDASRITTVGPGGYFGRQTGGSRLTQMQSAENSDNRTVLGNRTDIPQSQAPAENESDIDRKATKLHSKSSTQLLHEKINMLGKSQPSRGTKSITPAPQLAAPQVSYPDLAARSETPFDNASKPTHPEASQANSRPMPQKSQAGSPQRVFREPTVEPPVFPKPDSRNPKWESPARESRFRSVSPERRSPGPKPFNPAGFFHAKSVSTTSLASPKANTAGPLHKTGSITSPVRESATPSTSPKRYDGPLSASKSRLQSIMKTAKGLFTSSAGVSAAAKMETWSPTANRTQQSLYPNITGTMGSQQSLVDSPPRDEPRRTRSSIEKEEKRKEKERQEKLRMEEQLEKARQQEKEKAAAMAKAREDKIETQKPERILPPKAPAPATRTSPRKAQQEQAKREPEPARQEESKFTVPALPKPNESRRPVKPTRETQKPKPQPVNIRVGTLSQRIPLAGPPLSSSAQDPTPAPAPAPAPAKATVSKKGSNSSLQTAASTNSFKSSTSSASSKSKAAIAAEKKREQEQREAQRKLEQRREAERKKAAAQEEARRQEQLNRAEAERRERERERERSVVDDPKKLAQKQAIERRRLENARKLEQQRSQQPTPSNGRNSVLQQDKSGFNNSQGPGRPPSRMNSVQPPNRPMQHPQPNASKPPKRPVEDDNRSRQTSVKPGAVHQADGKRRKTEDEIVVEPPIRPTMAPPIRQSNVRKDGPKQQLFAHGYSTMQQPPLGQGGQPIFKNPAGAPRHFQPSGPMDPNRSGHPLEMAKFANGKIPFAEPPSQPHRSHKSPAPNQRALRSSPHYPNGDNIKLPEIPTDSEDEDSDAEPYTVPEWAKEDNLARLLVEQEGRDGEQVFGPSAPLHMEEIFKDNKDRIRKFRDRTSSANWAGPDGLTQEEVRWDLAERERLKRNGGWTYGT